MAQPNQVSVNIPEADQKAIQEAFAVLRSKLMPHLQVLTPQERIELPKMGEKSMAFVVKGSEYAVRYADLAPAFLDVPALVNDVQTVELLRGYSQELTPLVQAVEDTLTAAGSEAYVGTLMLYGNAKLAAKGKLPNAEAVYNDLSARFPGRTSARSAAK